MTECHTGQPGRPRDESEREGGSPPPPAGASAALPVPHHRWSGGERRDGRDTLVVEAPLELRIRGEPVAAVMRTPGRDRELAVGFFFCEGWIDGAASIGALCLGQDGSDGSDGRDRRGDPPGDGGAPAGAASPPGVPPIGVADLVPESSAAVLRPVRPRRGPVTSSCGVCGTATAAGILESVGPLRSESGPPIRVPARALTAAVRALRAHQPLFERTGALHAAGLFGLDGRPRCVMEDIGRHNAADKVIGDAVLRGEIPLRRRLLVVSGRASFEIVQKALRGRIPVVVAVSGVSHLAYELADRGGITLCGFARGDAFNVYSHPQRIEA